MSRERSMSFKAPNFSCRQGLAVAIAVVLLILLVITGRPAHAAQGQRVLSLAPSVTEMLFALGLGSRVVGVTTYCNYPAAATKKPRVGDALALNDELAMSLKPDLILAAEGDRARLDRLARLTGAKLEVLSTKRVSDIWTNMRAIGRLTGTEAHAAREATALQARLKAAAARYPARTPAPTAFYMVWDQPLMAAGPDSYLDDLIQLAGARNVVKASAGNSYPAYSWESLLAANPSVILGPRNMAGPLKKLESRYPHLQAVKAKRVRTLPDDLISRPGPRVVEAFEAVATALR